MGREARTSARPPVLAKGSNSAETIRTRSGGRGSAPDMGAGLVPEVAFVDQDEDAAARASTASMTSWSRSEPATETMARTPASRAASGPSAKGKKASEAR